MSPSDTVQVTLYSQFAVIIPHTCTTSKLWQVICQKLKTNLAPTLDDAP